ncbi:MAG: hypothetical protein ABR543_09990 [Gemmatimonadaceae bacterium]
MNRLTWPYLHLVVNHIPIVLTALGAVASAAALITRRSAVWLYAVATLTFAGLSTYPVKFSGERAEHVMEDTWYADEDAIGDHEEAAERAMWTLMFMGAVSAFAWWRLVRGGPSSGVAVREPVSTTTVTLPLGLRLLVVASSLAGLVTVGNAAVKGRQIVHESSKLEAPPSETRTP